jgi:hypothetical protein
MRLLLLLICLSAAAWIHAAPLPSGTNGIARIYPGDAGIERDPSVVFVENFEAGSLEAMWRRWESVAARPGMFFTNDTPAGSSGRQAMVMDRSKGTGSHLYRRLKDAHGNWGFERVFARYYVKFDPESGEVHHFGTCLGGNWPATPWPQVRAGQPTDGARSFWSGIEPYGRSWTWDYYTYWCDMRASPPRGQFWGNSFIRDPNLKVQRGKWICVEHMIQLNTVGQTNGEQALWIDGHLVSHLGPGFPRGLWTYDKFNPGRGGEGIRWNHEKRAPERFPVPGDGVPFEGFRWRTVPELKVNYLWLYIYTEKPAGHSIRVSFDHVVVATNYIGPLSVASKTVAP